MRTVIAVLLFLLSTAPSFAQKFDVKIIDRKNNETSGSYAVPGRTYTTTNATANCNASVAIANCNGSQNTTTHEIPPTTVSYQVQGATLSLLLPDGRIAVVNCNIKSNAWGGFHGPRSCRIPSPDNIRAEFSGDNAKLIWPVSLDGKKKEEETYKIVQILEK